MGTARVIVIVPLALFLFTASMLASPTGQPSDLFRLHRAADQGDPASAQDGGIAGTVTDDTGGVLPGATVEASGAALAGPRVAFADGIVG